MLSDQRRRTARSLGAHSPAIALNTFRCDTTRSTIQLLTTSAGFVLTWLVMWLFRDQGYWITLLLAFPAGGFMLRLFAIQHDCGHGAFFKSRGLNDFVGRTLGVFTLTPYKYWRRLHAVHHANSGNLDRRGIGDIEMLTVAEYRGLSRMKQIAYRLYRHPIVLLGIGPLYLFLFKHRLPFDLPLTQGQAWQSVLGTNLAIIILVAAMMWLVGPGDFIRIQLPTVVLASSAGVWLFFVQHQFEAAYWRRDKDWNFREAALGGSSYYRLPKILQWMTASIGLHHVHHLSSRIPNYRLQEVLERTPELKASQELTLRQSLACITLSLWDEDAGKMIRFNDLGNAAR